MTWNKIMINRGIGWFLIVLLAAASCGKRQTESGEKILVRIDGRVTISLNEFLRRAEYTPRPVYCRQNTYLNKKIILNSLIAEKLLAMESGSENSLENDPGFQRYLQGRQEQAMRQWMHHVEAADQVKLSQETIHKAFQLAGREYEIQYFTVNDTSISNHINQQINFDSTAFESLYAQLTGDERIPERKVKWIDKEHPAVHQALFSRDYRMNEVLKPIPIDRQKTLYIKIKGWSDEMAMTDKQQRERLDKVTEKLTASQSSRIWTERVEEIMHGKRLDFNPDVFNKLNALFFRVYFHTDIERRDQFIDKVWGREEQDPQKIMAYLNDEAFLNAPFFKVDNQVWTVADFREAIKYHPLVYRERKMPASEFGEQFRLAVADLVRDVYVTEAAYEQGYAQVPAVQRNVAMWRDAYTAIFQKKTYLDSVGETRNFDVHYMDILEDHLNAYIRQLQEKYHKKIELDFELFESISLSSIDLFVKQPEMPFKYVVPMFPIVTSNHLIDYIKRMEK